MSTFRSILSSVKYHALTRPAITAAIKGRDSLLGKLKQRLHEKKMERQGRTPGLRDAILRKTRGNLAYNDRLLSKTTKAGQKRRKDLAEQMKISRGYEKKLSADAARRDKIRKTTRGMFYHNQKLLKPLRQGGSLAALKRRKELAKIAWGKQRPQRGRSAPSPGAPSKKPPGPPPGGIHVEAQPGDNNIRSPETAYDAVRRSGNYGQLRRNLAGIAVRNFTREIYKNPKMTGQQVRDVKAKALRKMRAVPAYREKIKKAIGEGKGKLYTQAAKIIHDRV